MVGLPFELQSLLAPACPVGFPLTCWTFPCCVWQVYEPQAGEEIELPAEPSYRLALRWAQAGCFECLVGTLSGMPPCAAVQPPAMLLPCSIRPCHVAMLQTCRSDKLPTDVCLNCVGGYALDTCKPFSNCSPALIFAVTSCWRACACTASATTSWAGWKAKWGCLQKDPRCAAAGMYALSIPAGTVGRWHAAGLLPAQMLACAMLCLPCLPAHLPARPPAHPCRASCRSCCRRGALGRGQQTAGTEASSLAMPGCRVSVVRAAGSADYCMLSMRMQRCRWTGPPLGFSEGQLAYRLQAANEHQRPAG